MLTLSTVLTFLFLLLVLTQLVTSIRPMPLTGALPLAFAGLIGLESIVFNFLSMFQLVSRLWVLAAHILLLGVWLFWVLRHQRRQLETFLVRLQHNIRRGGRFAPWHLLVPLILFILLAATLFGPNNYDSLTYHMARVVHWMQNHSVDYYGTINDRQNAMGPGAEYLILFFQLLTESDTLAPLVQFIAWLLLIVACGHLSRLLRLPQNWSPFIVILAATAPIAVMEASNTKNDLVAALMTLAMLIAGARLYLGKWHRIRSGDITLLAIAGAAGYLVKPTSLLIAAPLVLFGVIVQLPGLFRSARHWKMILPGVLVLPVVFALVAGPDLYRKQSHQVSRHEVYPLFSEYSTDRLWNPVRVFAHNTPFPAETRTLLASIGYGGEIVTKDVFNLNEDMIGNPYQAVVVAVLAAMSLLLWPILLLRGSSWWRAWWLSLYPLAAWFFFGIVVKDQAWITRLEMPLFFLLPFSFALIGRMAGKYQWLRVSGTAIVGACALVSLAYATVVATKIPARPLIPHYFWGEKQGRVQSYYNNAPMASVHDSFLGETTMRQCRRIGLIMGVDSVEYPLIWQAYKYGIESRHLRRSVSDGRGSRYEPIPENQDWPCMIFADDGVAEHVPNRDSQWRATGDGHSYYRDDSWDFDLAETKFAQFDVGNVRSWIAATEQLQLRTTEKGLIIDALGDDPQIIMTPISAGDADQLLLRLIVASPVESTLQLYYLPTGSPFYNEENSISRPLVKGDNTIYLRLNAQEITGQLRLDIGKLPGEYLLSSLEIRTLPAGVRANR